VDSGLIPRWFLVRMWDGSQVRVRVQVWCLTRSLSSPSEATSSAAIVTKAFPGMWSSTTFPGSLFGPVQLYFGLESILAFSG
jgi:hypothetical protein